MFWLWGWCLDQHEEKQGCGWRQGEDSGWLLSSQTNKDDI